MLGRRLRGRDGAKLLTEREAAVSTDKCVDRFFAC